jgi:integrase
MNPKELNELLNLIADSNSPNSEALTAAILQLAADSATLKVLQSQQAQLPQSQTEEEQSDTFDIKLTQKDLKKIPMKYRKEFLINDCLVKCRRRKSGKHTTNYEIRYRKHGLDIQVSSNDLDEVVKKFIEALIAKDKGIEKPVVPTKFAPFAEYYFENYRKRKVAAKTFENDMYRYNKHIKPYFGNTPIKEISPAYCQKLLDGFIKKGMTKTNNEVYSLLNGIFKMAIAHNIIDKNPLAVVIIEKHKRTHGTTLTKAEEQKLLTGLAGTRYQLLMAVALYTGLRPNEYKTAEIKGDFIVAKNSKRKNGKEELKRIPICPMLKKYLDGVDKLDFPRLEYMRDNFNKILPDHILYDPRTTFYTRCEECGVAPAARDEFVGHSRGELNNTYSDLSDQYLLEEGKKLIW